MATDSELDETIAAVAAEAAELMNLTYGDAVLLVGRVLGGRPEAASAVVVGVDAGGLDLLVHDLSGEHPVRIPFARPATGVDDLYEAAAALVLQAREASGEPGETSVERDQRSLSTIRTFLTTVAAVHDVHPHLRRITFRGGDLDTFAQRGPDTFMFVLLPPPGRTTLGIDRSFTWDAWERMPAAEQPVGAYYTVRAWRPEVAELDALFVLHTPAGPASAWAARAQPGDPVALWGPREAFHPPKDTAWYLLVADDTALPAVAVILEQLPPGVPMVVVAEVDHEGEHLDLPAREGVTVHWVHRHGAPPGEDPQRLVDVVRGLELPAGRGYVWGGAESRAMTAVRRHVRGERGLERTQVSLVAYWRHAADATGEDGGDDDGEE